MSGPFNEYLDSVERKANTLLTLGVPIMVCRIEDLLEIIKLARLGLVRKRENVHILRCVKNSTTK